MNIFTTLFLVLFILKVLGIGSVTWSMVFVPLIAMALMVLCILAMAWALGVLARKLY